MPRALFVGTTIVAAFQLHLAAVSPLVVDAPLPQAVAELALRLDVPPDQDPRRFVADLVRRVYSTPDAKPPELPAPRAGAPPPTLSVPLPLPLDVWSRVIFRRAIPPDQLLAFVIRDPRAAHLARGLSALDDETLAFLAERPQLLQFLYEQTSQVFAGFGDVLRVRGGRLVLPGGEAAVPLWEGALGITTDRVDAAIRMLYGARQGRLAYLAATIDAAEPAAARFALGLWIPDLERRIVRFRALVDATTEAYREWSPIEHPFYRPLGDLNVLLLRIHVDETGAPAQPDSRQFWSAALDASPTGRAAEPGEGDRIDAAWLVGATGGFDMYARAERVDQFAFGTRVFGTPPDRAGELAAVEVIRMFPRRRMLLLELDRLGVRALPVYAAALRGASVLERAGSEHRFWSFAQYEGAMAVVARLRRSGTISAAQAEALLTSLGNLALRDGEYHGAVVQWFRQELGPILPEGRDWEERMAVALGGARVPVAQQPRLTWEGQPYRFDWPLAERLRIEAVRRKQGGHTLDIALALDAIATSLDRSDLDQARLRTAAASARELLQRNVSRLRHPPVNLMPPAVTVARDAAEWLTAALRDLDRAVASTDLRRGARVASTLRQLSDVVFGNALVSVNYAVELGDPEGAAMLAGNVALRHDFGFGRREPDARERQAWSQPRQDFQPGVPWHVAGSLVGLDIALAPLKLRRLAIDRMADAPRLSSIEREGVAVGVVFLDPTRLTNRDRDAIGTAIAGGRERVRGLMAGREPLETIMEQLAFDGLRRRALEWSLVREPATVPRQFSLVELLILGGGAPGADLDAWGAPALYGYGCACSRFPTPRAWRALEGRYQLPTVAATMGDLNLVVALTLHELDLPASLARPILEAAARDFIDELVLTGAGEWWGLSRQAQALKRQRFEDYIAAAAAVDGPLVPEDENLPPLE